MLPDGLPLDGEIRLLIYDIGRFEESVGGTDEELADYLRAGREDWGQLGRLGREL